MYLAALHYNENSDRSQAVTEDGQLRYGVRLRKFNKTATVHKIYTESTYGMCNISKYSVIEQYILKFLIIHVFGHYCGLASDYYMEICINASEHMHIYSTILTPNY